MRTHFCEVEMVKTIEWPADYQNAVCDSVYDSKECVIKRHLSPNM